METEGKILQHLASNIHSLRKVRGLTQKDLANITGIPRSTITNLESGNANPTLVVLKKVSSTLKVSMEELIKEPRGEYKLVLKKDVPIVEKTKGYAQLHKLLPDPIPGMEIDRLELSPGKRMKGNPHLAHTKEYFTCIKGKINISSGGNTFELSQGDVLAFPGDLAHSYFNPTNVDASGISVVVLK